MLKFSGNYTFGKIFSAHPEDKPKSKNQKYIEMR
jgi:hypothetical protein